jgi:hypothetical protein
MDEYVLCGTIHSFAATGKAVKQKIPQVRDLVTS